jgi:hypothetical protein
MEIPNRDAWRFTVRPPDWCPFALDEKPKSFADHLAGVVVEAGGDFAPDVFLKLSRKRDVHGFLTLLWAKNNIL